MNAEELERYKQLEAMKKAVVHKVLTKKALERLNRVRLVKPELVEQLELYFLQLHESGQLRGTIDEERLKKILLSLSSKNKFRIRR